METAIEDTTDVLEYLESKADFKKYGIKRSFSLSHKFKINKSLTVNEKTLYIKGYASTTTKDRTDDIVTYQALEKSKNDLLQPGSTTVFYNHDKSKAIGKVMGCTLDEKGLIVNIKISNADDVKDIRTKIKEGVLSSLSIGGRFKKVQIERDEDGRVTSFKVLELELFEVSVVGIPANAEASITSVVEKSLKNLSEKDNDMSTKEKSNKEEKNANDGQISNDGRKGGAKTGTETVAAKPSGSEALSNDARKEVEAIVTKAMEPFQGTLSTIADTLKAMAEAKTENKEEKTENKEEAPAWAKKITDDLAAINKAMKAPVGRKGTTNDDVEPELKDEGTEEEETEEGETVAPKKVLKSHNDQATMDYLNYVMNEDTEAYEKLSESEKALAGSIWMKWYDLKNRKS